MSNVDIVDLLSAEMVEYLYRKREELNVNDFNVLLITGKQVLISIILGKEIERMQLDGISLNQAKQEAKKLIDFLATTMDNNIDESLADAYMTIKKMKDEDSMDEIKTENIMIKKIYL